MARVPHPIKSHAALTYREPLSVRVGRYGLRAGAVLVLLIVLYVIAWFVTSMELRKSIRGWFEARQQAGYIATHDEAQARISGFPFAVKATLKDVHFAPPKNGGEPRAWSWNAQQVVFSITPLPWTVRRVTVDLHGQQTLNWDGQSYKGHARRFDYTFDWLSEGVAQTMQVEIQNLSLENAKGHALNIESLNGDTARRNNGAYGYELKAENIILPKGVVGMGHNVPELIVRGRFTQAFGEQGVGREELADWRDAGGTMEVERLLIGYDPLRLQGNGTLALDGDLQPVGAFSARIQGFFETVGRLNRAGVIRGPDASMAKVVLGMLAKQPKNGGPSTISLPLTIQDRALYAGPVRLIELPQLEW